MADPKRTGPRRGPPGDVIPSDTDLGPRTSGGSPPEEVEDRRNVGKVRPEDYPLKDRNKGK
ncbi:MAG TPA: hypothetical protein VL918_03910 [Sphingobium sp.]|nr:hypothetical protein [Sphingobium sp.]